MPEVAMHVIISQQKGAQHHGNSKKLLVYSSLIHHQLWGFCSLHIYNASVAEMSLQNYLCCKTEGAKLMKCLFNKPVSLYS